MKQTTASFSHSGTAWDGGRSPETDPVETRGAPSGAAVDRRMPGLLPAGLVFELDAPLERGLEAAELLKDVDRALEDHAFDPGEFLTDRGVGLGGLGGLGPASDHAPGPLQFRATRRMPRVVGLKPVRPRNALTRVLNCSSKVCMTDIPTVFEARNGEEIFSRKSTPRESRKCPSCL